MPKILISYYSKSGNTKKMAQGILQGIEVIKDIHGKILSTSETTIDDLFDSDAIIIGSPTYFGTMAAPVKKLIDESVKYFGKLEGKIGGAFTSSAQIGGGNETTLLSLIQAFMIHGMIIQGMGIGNHYGPVSIKEPDKQVINECINYGRLIANLVKKIC